MLLNRERGKANRSEFLTYNIQKEQKTIVFCSFLYRLPRSYFTNGGFVTLAFTF